MAVHNLLQKLGFGPDGPESRESACRPDDGGSARKDEQAPNEEAGSVRNLQSEIAQGFPEFLLSNFFVVLVGLRNSSESEIKVLSSEWTEAHSHSKRS
ncbi:MAG: hypothetical protein K2X27_11505 [Candidatus Obscuribacterales bacterium]|nr:hypothetical protein [Candidatus Obscuribacterales bacterium]